MQYKVRINNLVESASRATGAIIAKFKDLQNVHFTIFSKLYETGVIPILEYASEIWGFAKHHNCDQVQYKAIRYFLGVHRFTPVAGLIGDIGWVNTRDRRRTCIIKYWNKLVKMKSSRLTKKVFNWDFQISSSSNNWNSYVNKILNSVNMLSSFYQKKLININEYKNRLQINAKTQWLDELRSKPKLRTYMTFKDDIYTENYVKSFMPRRPRSLLAQLHLGVLPLHIETGRFKNIKDNVTIKYRTVSVEERKCLVCKLYLVEDEIHFVCTCIKYRNERLNFFKEVSAKNVLFNSMDCKEKFIYLIKCESILLATFIEKI